MDYDVGKDEKLGQCVVPPRVLYEGTGERLVFPLENKELKVGRGSNSNEIRSSQRHLTLMDRGVSLFGAAKQLRTTRSSCKSTWNRSTTEETRG